MCTALAVGSILRLTFSLLDGGGLVGGAWVCVAFGTPQTTPTTSATGVRALSINSFLGLFSAAVSTVRRNRDNRREFGGVEVPSVDFKKHLIGHVI